MYDKPVSYSGLSLFRKCPRAWADAYIDGNRGESGAAAMRGTKLHEQLETYFEGGVEYPIKNSVLRDWHEYMTMLMAHQPIPERQIATCAKWQPADFNDPSAHTRGAVDLEYMIDDVLYLYDWKSGKVYDTHVEQGQFYAAMSAHRCPSKTVVRFVYLDIPGYVVEWQYTPDACKRIQEKLDAEIQVLRVTDSYPANPSQDNCKWCSLGWRRGGTCHASP
jgi:hypothetical protein